MPRTRTTAASSDPDDRPTREQMIAAVRAVEARAADISREIDRSLDEIRRLADSASAALAARNRAIRSAVAAGNSQRAVARAAGLTHPAIGKIIARDDPDQD